VPVPDVPPLPPLLPVVPLSMPLPLLPALPLPLLPLLLLPLPLPLSPPVGVELHAVSPNASASKPASSTLWCLCFMINSF
jgi:hypothetical protein